MATINTNADGQKIATEMPSAAFNLSPILFIILFLLSAISSNFAHSNDFGDFEIYCNKLSESLDTAMGENIVTPMPIPLDILHKIRCFAASSDTFANGLHSKMENFSVELTKFVEISKKYEQFLPRQAFKYILNEEGIKAFGNMFLDGISSSPAAAQDEKLMAKRLKGVLDVRNKDKSRPEFLTKIFTILDNLTVDTKEYPTREARKEAQYLYVRLTIHSTGRTMDFELAKFVVDFLSKVRKFVRNLKRELIYAQSEGTIRMMDNEFNAFTTNVIDPIKEKATKYAQANFKWLSKEIVAKYNKKLEKVQFPFKNGLILPATIGGTAPYDNLYQQQLEKRKKGISWIEKGKMWKNSVLSKLQKEDKILKQLFDKLEEKFMKNTKETPNFLIEYHQYVYVYGMLKNCAKELNQKMGFLIEQLVANGPAAIANKFEHEKRLIFALVENILKPLLNVIDQQMAMEYGQRIDVKIIEEKLALPREMIDAEITMIKSSIAKRDITKPVRQYRIRINAVKVLVMYERLKFFFNLFKNEKNKEKREEMAHEWLKGNLNGQRAGELCTPERFGQLLFNATKRLMMPRH